MIEATLNWDLEELFEGYDEMSAAGRDLRPVWREVKPLVREDVRDHFKTREGPDDTWPPRDKASRGQRRMLLGRLRTAWSFEIFPRLLRIVSKVPWSGVHQDGGRAGHGASIPQRVHMYFSEKFLDVLVDRLAEHLVRRW